MPSRTQFKQNYLLDIAYVIMEYFNLELFFWQFIFFAFETENGVTMSPKRSFLSLIFTCWLR